MQEKYGDQGLRVVAVNAWDEPSQEVREFVEEKKLPYTVLLNGGAVFEGPYKGMYIPHLYLLNQAGKIVYTHEGWEPGDEKKLTRKIEQLLKKS